MLMFSRKEEVGFCFTLPAPIRLTILGFWRISTLRITSRCKLVLLKIFPCLQIRRDWFTVTRGTVRAGRDDAAVHLPQERRQLPREQLYSSAWEVPLIWGGSNIIYRGRDSVTVDRRCIYLESRVIYCGSS